MEYKVAIHNDSGRPEPHHYAVFSALPEIRGLGVEPSSIRRTVCFTSNGGVLHGGQAFFSSQKKYYAIIGELQYAGNTESIQWRHHEEVRLGRPGADDGSVVEARCDPSGTLSITYATYDGGSNSLNYLTSSPAGTFTISCLDNPPAGHNIVIGIAELINTHPVVLAAVPYTPESEYVIRPREGFLVKQLNAEVGQVVPDAALDSFAVFFQGFGRSVTMIETHTGHIVPDVPPGTAIPKPHELDTAPPNWIPAHPISLPPPDPFVRRSQTSPAREMAAPHAPASWQPPAVDAAAPITPPRKPPNPNFSSRGSNHHEPSTPSTTPQRISSHAGASGKKMTEDKFNLLRKYDTLLLIDDSGSMWGSPWNEVRNLLGELAPIVTQYDDDGVDIYFLNYQTNVSPRDIGIPGRATGGYFRITDQKKVEDIFNSMEEPVGSSSTPTGDRLRFILKPYLDFYKEKLDQKQENVVKPLNVIIITDGEADDDVEGTIVWAARRLDNWEAPPDQVGLQFFQIGDDEDAKNELDSLDNDLASRHKIRDMVDTRSWDKLDEDNSGKGPSLSAEAILKVVLGAVNRKIDKKK